MLLDDINFESLFKQIELELINKLNAFDAIGTYMSQGIAKQYQKFISALEMPWDGIDRCLMASGIM